jgi:hypothetical protein
MKTDVWERNFVSMEPKAAGQRRAQLVASLTAVMVILAIALALAPGEPVQSASLYALHRLEVAQVAFTNASALAAMGHPARVKGSPVRQWNALHWTIESLLKRSSEPKKFWSSRQRLFHYHDDSQALAEALIERGVWERTHHDVNLTLEAFVRACAEPGQELYYYYTGEAEDESGQVVDDLRPVEPLVVGGPSAGHRVTAWVGCAGIAMQAHYDLAHNMFVHLVGRKTFYLLPPHAAASVYCAGKGHPQFRSSLIPDLSRVPLGEFPLFGKLREVWVAELGPGDVLYVPPGWIHAVHSGGPAGKPSVSVNVFSVSAEREALDEIEALPIPFEAEWPRETMLAAVPALIALVSSLVHRSESPHGTEGELERTDRGLQRLVQEWASSRWAHLAGETSAVLTDCHLNDPLFATAHFYERATAIAEGFQRMESDGLRQTLMQNYWDTLVAFTMEWDPFLSARYAVDIARACFAFE